MRAILFRLFLAFLAGLTVSTGAAADGRKLVALSAMGDTLTVVTHRPEVGTHIDQNVHETIQLPDASFDKFAATAMSEFARRADPQLAVDVFVRAVPGEQDAARWIDDKKFNPPADVRADVVATGATHLLLVTRLKASTVIKTGRAGIGSGFLEGLGFYIDRSKSLTRSDTGETAVGLLAPYAYLRVLLIDLRSGEVVTDKLVRASRTFSAARSKDGVDPWQALDASQKVEALRRLIRSELNRVVPEILREM